MLELHKKHGDRDAIPTADGTSRNLPKRDVLHFRPASPANHLTMKVLRLRKVCKKVYIQSPLKLRQANMFHALPKRQFNIQRMIAAGVRR